MKTLTESPNAFGIGEEYPLPQTHLAWMVDLARLHGETGLRYALSLKINHAPYIDYTNHIGFRVLVAEVLRWRNDRSAALLELLRGDFAWAARYVATNIPGLPIKPVPLPLPPLEVNYQLASAFGDEERPALGLPYALRYYTAPSVIGDTPMWKRQPQSLRDFIERIIGRQDWLTKKLIATLALPEFKPLAHLMPRAGSDSKGDTVLDMTMS